MTMAYNQGIGFCMAEATEEHSAAQSTGDNSLNEGQQLHGRYGCLDLEINRAGQLYDIGALLAGETFSRHCRGTGREALPELDVFLAPAEVLLGHNLLVMTCPPWSACPGTVGDSAWQKRFHL